MTFDSAEMVLPAVRERGLFNGDSALAGHRTTGCRSRDDTADRLPLRDAPGDRSAFGELIGEAPALQAALSRVSKVAPTDSTVLISGETGTGKELVARDVHRRSPRSARPFVSVNCAAIPTALIASELFGHERGAFTGAMQRRLGRFELAAGGTLFLDEVGELPVETQITLLRVLQEREFERVGGSQAIRSNVRLIAATNRDLQAALASGGFRSDLFYRLSVFPIELPPLRARTEDIRALVEHFVAHYARRMEKTIRWISKRTLAFLEAYPWPGNVRELQNVIERSVIVCDSEVFTIDAPWLAAAGRGSQDQAPPSGSSETLEGVSRAHIVRVLEETNWTLGGPGGAAVRLGMKRTTLQSLLKRLGIAPVRSDGTGLPLTRSTASTRPSVPVGPPMC